VVQVTNWLQPYLGGGSGEGGRRASEGRLADEGREGRQTPISSPLKEVVGPQPNAAAATLPRQPCSPTRIRICIRGERECKFASPILVLHFAFWFASSVGGDASMISRSVGGKKCVCHSCWSQSN
jgi:hypothetical protein